MRINIIVRGAGIYPLDSRKVLVKGEMNKREVMKHLYGIVRSNPWVWDYLVQVRDKFDAKGIK